MIGAPVGRVVSLYYDSLALARPGEYLQTVTGKTYHVLENRRQEKGMYRGRQHIKALVVEGPPAGAVVHPIFWYPRGKHQKQGTFRHQPHDGLY